MQISSDDAVDLLMQKDSISNISCDKVRLFFNLKNCDFCLVEYTRFAGSKCWPRLHALPPAKSYIKLTVPPSVNIFSWALDECGAAWTCSSKQPLPSVLEVNIIRHNHHLHSTLFRVHFLWMRRTGMLPFTWLAFPVWFICERPGFVHSDEFVQESRQLPFGTDPIRQVRQRSGAIVAARKCHGVPNALQVCANPEYPTEYGAQFCDILRLPLLTHAQCINNQHPAGKQGVEQCCSPRGVILHGGCPERHPSLPGTL